MTETFDRQKIIDCMFDPLTSAVLAELEDGKKECSFLAQKFSIPESEVLERLSYLIECRFITRNSDGCTLVADHEKLTAIIEDNDAAIDGLAKLDSYLN